jgi:hypothetical protein
MRATWAALDDEWAKTITRALARPEGELFQSVDGEWSFVQTVRHLVFAMDKWFTAPILGEGFHPIGLPNRFSADFPWPGLDDDASPSVSEALAVRADRSARFREPLASVPPADLTRTVEVLENGPSRLEECIATVFEEEFWHNRYALRDRAQLDARSGSTGAVAQADAQRCHSPGTPLSTCVPRSSNPRSEPITRSFTVLVTSTSPGPASEPTRAPMCTPMPATSLPRRSISPVWRPALT